MFSFEHIIIKYASRIWNLDGDAAGIESYLSGTQTIHATLLIG